MVKTKPFTANLVSYNNILIIQTAFIGDAILASSLVEKLTAFFPEANISMLVRKGNEGIYAGHPHLKEVLVWNKKENKIKNLFLLLKTIRKNKYDCVINCHRFASSGILTAFSGARHTAGYKQNPFSFLFNTTVRHALSEGRHEVERYQQLVADFTDDLPAAPKLYPTAADKEYVRNFQKDTYVCFAPASVWFTKQLPIEKWIELSAQIQKEKTIYLLGAATDVALCEKILLAHKHPNIISLAGKLSLLQSAALIQKASMNYVNDSAPLHLASATNAPVTAFFCSTIPAFGFGPYNINSEVREVQGLSCKPCGVHGFKDCPKGHFKCGHEMNLQNLN